MAETHQKISLLGFSIWLLAALFFLYEFFLRTFIGSIAHQIIPDLHLNAETFAILGSAYYIAYSVMQIPVGILADRFGIKAILAFASLVCGAATYLFSTADGFTSAFIGRLLMGFGSSFAFVCLLVIALTWFPRRLFGLFAGISQFVGTLGPLFAAGPLIALMHHLHTSWRHALAGIALFGIALCILVLLIVKNKPRDTDQAIIYLDRSIELKTKLKRLIRNPQAWAVAFYSAAIYAPLALLGAIWGTEYLQTRGLSQATAADIISAAWLGYAIGCPLLGACSDILKRRSPLLITSALLALIVTCCITYLPSASTALYGTLFFLLGLSAAGQNVGFAAITEHVDTSSQATALGLNNGMIMLFSAILPPAVSWFILSSSSQHQSPLQSHDFMIGFSAMPLLSTAALIISALIIRETYCKPQKHLIKLNPS